MNPRASPGPKFGKPEGINHSEHSEREGEAPWALPMEGATGAPVNNLKFLNQSVESDSITSAIRRPDMVTIPQERGSQ